MLLGGYEIITTYFFCSNFGYKIITILEIAEKMGIHPEKIKSVEKIDKTKSKRW